MPVNEYKPGSSLPGIDRADDGSVQPCVARAAAGGSRCAEIVLWIVLDDTGYGQFGCGMAVR